MRLVMNTLIITIIKLPKSVLAAVTLAQLRPSTVSMSILVRMERALIVVDRAIIILSVPTAAAIIAVSSFNSSLIKLLPLNYLEFRVCLTQDYALNSILFAKLCRKAY
jgi:hypothetical protein